MQRRWPNRACSGAKRDKERIALHLATATATWARCVAHRQHQSIVALRGGVGSVPFSASANAETSKLAAQSPWQVLWTLSLPDLHLVILALVALTLAGQSSEKPFDKVTLYSTNARALAFEHWWCLHWQRLVRLHSHTPTHPHPPTSTHTFTPGPGPSLATQMAAGCPSPPPPPPPPPPQPIDGAAACGPGTGGPSVRRVRLGYPGPDLATRISPRPGRRRLRWRVAPGRVRGQRARDRGGSRPP